MVVDIGVDMAFEQLDAGSTVVVAHDNRCSVVDIVDMGPGSWISNLF